MRRTSSEGAEELNRRIYAVDVGSTRAGSFAWAARATEGGQAEVVVVSTNISLLAEWISRDLRQGVHVALGFEAPLSLPVPMSADDLFLARTNERLAWSGQVGALITAQAVHLAAWILREIHQRGAGGAILTTNPADWPPAFSTQPVLLCWEAFVSGSAHARRGDDAHARDAATAVWTFIGHEANLRNAQRITSQHPLSLVAAAAMWAGWVDDAALLRIAPVVIEAVGEGYGGSIRWLSGAEFPS